MKNLIVLAIAGGFVGLGIPTIVLLIPAMTVGIGRGPIGDPVTAPFVFLAAIVYVVSYFVLLIVMRKRSEATASACVLATAAGLGCVVAIALFMRIIGELPPISSKEKVWALEMAAVIVLGHVCIGAAPQWIASCFKR